MNKGIVVLLSIALVLAGCSDNRSPEDLYNEAITAKADHSKAIVLLKNAITLEPENAKYRMALAEAYKGMGNALSAEKEFNRSMELGFIGDDYLTLQSEILLQLGSYDELLVAISDYQERSSEGLTNKQNLYKLLSYLYVGEASKAKQLLKGFDVNEQYAEHISTAMSLAFNNEVEKANNILLELPTNAYPPEFSLFWGKYLATNEKHGEAIPYFEYYNSSHIQNGEIKLALARSYVATDQVDAAINVLTPFLKSYPNNSMATTLFAVGHFKKGDFDTASEYAEKSLSLGNSDVRNRVVLGLINFKEARYEQAYTHLKIAINNLPSGHAAHQILWATQIELGEQSGSFDDEETLANINNIDLPVLANWARVSLTEGDYSKANRILNSINSIEIGSEYEQAKVGELNLLMGKAEGLEQLYNLYSNSPILRKSVFLIKQLIGANDFERAQQQIDRLKEIHAGEGVLHFLQGIVSSKQGDNSRADDEFKALLGLEPENIFGNMYFANSALKKKEFEQAISLSDKVLSNQKAYLPALLIKNKGLVGLGKEDEALEHVLSALAVPELNLVAKLQLIRILHQFKKYDEARAYLAPLAENKNLPKLYWQLAANDALKANDPDKALDTYEQWYLQNGEPEAIFRKVHLLEQKKAYSEAIADIDRLLALDADNAHMNTLKAHYLVLSGEALQALELLDKVTVNEAIKANVSGIRGKVLNRLQRYEEALPLLSAEYKRRPTRANMFELYRLYKSTNQALENMKLLEQYLSNSPTDLTAYLLLAELYEQNARNKDAPLVYMKVLEIDAENMVALNNIANSYLKLNQADLAAPYAEKASVLYSGSAEVLNTQGNVLLALNKTDQAINWFDKALSIAPSNQAIILDAALAHAMKGNTEKSQQLLSQVTESKKNKQKVDEIKALNGSI